MEVLLSCFRSPARLILDVINDKNKNTKGKIFNAGSNKNNLLKDK